MYTQGWNVVSTSKATSPEASVRVTLSQFLERLFEDGRVMVSAPEPVPADELRGGNHARRAGGRLPPGPAGRAPAAGAGRGPLGGRVAVSCLPVRGLSQCGRGNDRRRPRASPVARRRGCLAATIASISPSASCRTCCDWPAAMRKRSPAWGIFANGPPIGRCRRSDCRT